MPERLTALLGEAEGATEISIGSEKKASLFSVCSHWHGRKIFLLGSQTQEQPLLLWEQLW